jgi:hypothetical protein
VSQRRSIRILEHNGKRCLARALFEVTSGGVFWMVAVGPRQMGNACFPALVHRVHGHSLGWEPFARIQ